MGRKHGRPDSGMSQKRTIHVEEISRLSVRCEVQNPEERRNRGGGGRGPILLLRMPLDPFGSEQSPENLTQFDPGGGLPPGFSKEAWVPPPPVTHPLFQSLAVGRRVPAGTAGDRAAAERDGGQRRGSPVRQRRGAHPPPGIFLSLGKVQGEEGGGLPSPPPRGPLGGGGGPLFSSSISGDSGFDPGF